MADILGTDPRFGLAGNQTRQEAMGTLMQLLNPLTNRVSPIPRIQEQLHILGSEQMNKDAARGSQAAAGLTGSRAFDVLDEAIGAQATGRLAQSEYGELQRQEAQDRQALGAYLQMVLAPNIQAGALNEEERGLRDQLERLKKQRRLGNTLGALKLAGGIALMFVPGGQIAGAGMLASSASDFAANQ